MEKVSIIGSIWRKTYSRRMGRVQMDRWLSE